MQDIERRIDAVAAAIRKMFYSLSHAEQSRLRAGYRLPPHLQTTYRPLHRRQSKLLARYTNSLFQEKSRMRQTPKFRVAGTLTLNASRNARLQAAQHPIPSPETIREMRSWVWGVAAYTALLIEGGEPRNIQRALVARYRVRIARAFWEGPKRGDIAAELVAERLSSSGDKAA